MYPSVVARMSTEMRATHYNMNHQNRGVALIFNHEHFHIDGLKSRSGTHKDCEALESHLKKLGFEVHVFKDIDCNELCGHVDTCKCRTSGKARVISLREVFKLLIEVQG